MQISSEQVSVLWGVSSHKLSLQRCGYPPQSQECFGLNWLLLIAAGCKANGWYIWVHGKVLLPSETRLMSASGHKETLIWLQQEAHKSMFTMGMQLNTWCITTISVEDRFTPSVTQWGIYMGISRYPQLTCRQGIIPLSSFQVASEPVNNECHHQTSAGCLELNVSA